MADSSGYNLFYFELRMQYMWPIAGGYFVNVDFVVLGHSSNKRKGILTPFWWNKYCNKFIDHVKFLEHFFCFLTFALF